MSKNINSCVKQPSDLNRIRERYSNILEKVISRKKNIFYYNNLEIDLLAESVIKGENLQEFFNDSSVPVVVGDGNCLFNAISMYFTGSNGMTNILRLLTCI